MEDGDGMCSSSRHTSMWEEASEEARIPVCDASRGSGNRRLVFNARPRLLSNEQPLAISDNMTRDYCKYVHVLLAFFSGMPRVIPPSHAYPLCYNVSYLTGSYYQTECHLTVPPYNLPPVFVRPAQPFFQYESTFPMGIGTQPLQNAALLSIRSQSLVLTEYR